MQPTAQLREEVHYLILFLEKNLCYLSTLWLYLDLELIRRPYQAFPLLQMINEKLEAVHDREMELIHEITNLQTYSGGLYVPKMKSKSTKPKMLR
ncbi:hypothetical protein SLE2022_291120 [Rubroshorea leprosula]